MWHRRPIQRTFFSRQLVLQFAMKGLTYQKIKSNSEGKKLANAKTITTKTISASISDGKVMAKN
ncbi:unnamed protein product [Arabidopsis thaliana]|uniref:Uncharacterized protein n=1 Tax=Arabidopsis thaliana TaxID=3702 RepID=A0A5S9Y654_ARATH|nr:unnamed protein product [Arabidopsis thaliana]